MGRRTILVTCSVLLAGVGTLLVFLYAQNAERRAVAGQTLVSVLGSEDLRAAYVERACERFGGRPEELLARLLLEGRGQAGVTVDEQDLQVVIGGVAIKKR